MSDSNIQCVWFKRDLRITDHAPLVAAVERGSILAVYIVEPELVNAPDFDAMHWEFIRESLIDLQSSFAKLGGALRIEVGEACEVFDRLFGEFGFRHLWSHEETGNAITFKRDQRVARWAQSKGIQWVELSQNGVIRGLRDRDGWARSWETFMVQPIFSPPRCIQFVTTFDAEAPTSRELNLAASAREADLKGGESVALETLESFILGRGRRYHREMSSPNTAYESCSRLSPFFAWGCVSLRTAVQAIRSAAGNELPKVAARAVVSRFHWHCHFIQKLESQPSIEFHAFNRACDDLRSGALNLERLEAWKDGLTGYPFVDACIRSLKARGWINFRMRAMLVSFASYHLWIDWREFKDWLACQFIDYEPGIHISQVQMQSGLTGINTLRIYNPIKQGQDHDIDGTFIREWVPELKKVTNDFIHEPWKMPPMLQEIAGCELGRDYPLPIVDHKEAVRYARSQFSALRKRDDYWEESNRVMQQHGSRKGGSRPKRAKKKQASQTELDLG